MHVYVRVCGCMYGYARVLPRVRVHVHVYVYACTCIATQAEATALHLCVVKESGETHLRMVELLLEYGANKEISNKVSYRRFVP